MDLVVVGVVSQWSQSLGCGLPGVLGGRGVAVGWRGRVCKVGVGGGSSRPGLEGHWQQSNTLGTGGSRDQRDCNLL